MDRREYVRSVVGVGAVGLAGCVGGNADSQDYDVGMTTRAFEPEQIEISAGDTVVWKNTSSHGHSVTAYDDGLPDGATYFASGGFDDEQSARDSWADATDGLISQDRTYSHTFETAGQYTYFCIPHERSGMVGTILVE